MWCKCSLHFNNIGINDFWSYSPIIKMLVLHAMNENTNWKFLYLGSNIRHNMLWALSYSNCHTKHKNGSNMHMTYILIFRTSFTNLTFEYPPITLATMSFGMVGFVMYCWNFKLIMIATFNTPLNNQCLKD